MATTLITPNEVKLATHLPSEVSACTVADIRTIEYNLFAVNTIGLTVRQYDMLIENLATYPTAAEYNNTTNYTAGATVIYGGVYYKAKVNSVGVSPANTTNWGLAPKFGGDDADCLNAFWCDGSLRDVIAYSVVHNTMPRQYVQFTGAGLVKRSDTRMEAIDVSDFKVASEGFWNYVRASIQNLTAYIANNGAPCLAVATDGVLCTPCGTPILTSNSNLRPHYRVG